MKTAIIVTGPESSGSTYIAKHIAKKLQWTYSDALWQDSPLLQGEENIVIHISQPHGHDKFYPLGSIKNIYKNFFLKFIITTRDRHITLVSKKMRWRRPYSEGKIHYKKSYEILKEIMENEDYFLWNYETMIYLENAYFKQLYKHLNIDEDYIPSGIYDGNKKYIRGL